MGPGQDVCALYERALGKSSAPWRSSLPGSLVHSALSLGSFSFIHLPNIFFFVFDECCARCKGYKVNMVLSFFETQSNKRKEIHEMQQGDPRQSDGRHKDIWGLADV